MAFQILDKPSLGSLLGQGFGQGIGQLAQQKIQQMQTLKGLNALGLTSEQSKGLSKLPPELARLVIPQQFKNMERSKNMEMLSSLYGGPSLQQSQGIVPQGQPVQGQPAQAQLGQAQLGQAQPTQAQGQPGIMESLGYKPGQTAIQAYAIGADVGTALKLEQKAKEYNLKFNKELKKEKLEHKKYMTEQENKLWDKADPYISELMKFSKSSRVQNMDLNRLEEIGDKLTGPAWDAFLKGSGFDLASLRSPESSEFEAIKMSFMKDMKKYFGGNVSTREMEGFLKSLPDLSQTPDGRQRVISNMKRLNNVSIQYAKSAKQVIKNNKGVPPRDIQFKVEKIMKQRVKKVADQFIKDLKRPVPKFSSMDKGLTAIGHGVGSVIGAVPKLIGGLSGLFSRLGG